MGKLGAEFMNYLTFGEKNTDERIRIIVKYYGDLSGRASEFTDIIIVELYQLYAIVEIRKNEIERFAALPEVEYVELPKDVYFQVQEGRRASCITGVQGGGVSENPYQLTGRGVLVGIIDSGIDYSHPAFISSNGESRILYLWDQTADGNANPDKIPAGYSGGVEYNKYEIDAALREKNADIRKQMLPVTDRGSGHGTSVAAVAAGSGNGSLGARYRGVALESDLIVVKLGQAGEGFPRTTEIMEGINYVIGKAIELGMPAAVNLSFGNNNGAHNGGSLFENYITDVSGVWKNVICIASGNEGDARHHVNVQFSADAGRLSNTGRLPDTGQTAEIEKYTETVQIPFAVGDRIKELSIQVWKSYQDEFEFAVITPDNSRIPLTVRAGTGVEFFSQRNRIQVYYGEPSPYEMIQELYMRFLPIQVNSGRDIEQDAYISSGIWNLEIVPKKIADGNVNIWMPTSELIGRSTGFLRPDAYTTLTIPSTARKIITVGAYNTSNDTAASFSGRGRTADGRQMPDIVAPGVNIITAVPGGGYSPRTGTSIAAPFVAGSAALLMEWGIVRGNDPFLYGEKVKAYIIKGARRLPGQADVPDDIYGWGALCLRDSFPY